MQEVAAMQLGATTKGAKAKLWTIPAAPSCRMRGRILKVLGSCWGPGSHTLLLGCCKNLPLIYP
jgi:hypothetical protein